MGLTESERKELERLSKKKDAPDPPPINKSVTAHIDFSDEKQIERAIKHGFLTPAQAEEIKEGESDDDDDEDSSKRKPAADKKPRRRGYFDEK